MALSAKQKVSLAGLFGWLFAWLFDPFITIFRLNVETWAVRNNLDDLYSRIPWAVVRDSFTTIWNWIASAYLFVTGPFGLGFALAAVLFAFWDPITRFGYGLLRNSLELTIGNVTEGMFGEGGLMSFSVQVRNTSQNKTIKGVEVNLIKVGDYPLDTRMI